MQTDSIWKEKSSSSQHYACLKFKLTLIIWVSKGQQMCMIYKHKLWLRNVHKDSYFILSTPVHTKKKTFVKKFPKLCLLIVFSSER